MKLKELYSKIVECWGVTNKGKGLISMCNKIDYKPIIEDVITRLYNKNPDSKVVIITDKMDTRFEVNKFILNFNASLVNSKKVLIVTENFITSIGRLHIDLLILVNTHNYSIENTIRRFFDYRFVLGFNNSAYGNLSVKCPTIYKLAELDLLNYGILDNVLEVHIPSKLTNIESTDYNKANEYINMVVSTVGDISIIKKLREGDPDLGLSANQVAYNLAIDNGWSPNLDMSITYLQEIDKAYNPAVIQEKVSNYYNVTRERSILETRGLNKINIIVDIIRSNPKKKILIISKDADYATDITNYINKHIADSFTGEVVTANPIDVCHNFHNKQESIPMVDIETNDYFRYKSGAKKGEVKLIGKKAQHDMSMTMLAKDYIWILSGQNSIPDYTDIEIDAVIITSPKCDNLGTFKYRVSNLSFRVKPNIVFKLYNETTREETDINKIVSTEEVQVVKYSEIEDYSIDNLVSKFGNIK